MAQFSLTVSRWRMLRLALRKKRFRFEEVRSMARRDWDDLGWLVANGLCVDAGGGFYEVTETGRESADLGFYEWTPPSKAATPTTPTTPPAPKKRGKK